MAIMHPASIIESAHVKSEVKFYKACRDQLSDKYHVFYSVRWYSENNGIREDSECDFLIFNPNYGFICIEVKGGYSITVNGGEWRLDDDRGGRILKCSPYVQAEKSMRFFKSYYEEELETRFPGIYACAVAFPNYNIDSPITVDSPLEITIDMNDMSDLQRRITEVFRYYQGARAGGSSFLAPDAQKKFISLINKRIALSISAGALIEDKQTELVEINRTQDTIIDLLSHYPKAFIVGGAGTGKTWIGIKKIERCMLEGKKALFLCYNRALADMVKTLLPDGADCYNIDSLAYRLLQDKAVTAPVRNGVKEYSALIETLPTIKQYDLVVVDEGQDFTEDWAYCANLFVKDGGSIYVFYDESQNIFNREFGEKFFITDPPFVLRYNIRNTANIYRFAQDASSLGLDTLANRIEGVEPEIRRFTRKSQAISFVDSIVNKLVLKEGVASNKIVLLSNRKKENSIFDETEYIGRCQLLVDSGPDQEGIHFRTIQSFKGLESDIIIFVNHTYKDEPKTPSVRAMLYTAYTRARFFLYVINYEDSYSR